MAHRIDMSTGRPAIAYVGEVPWHSLGQKLKRGASIEEWTHAAGLAWQVMRSPVQFTAAELADRPLPQTAHSCSVLDRDVLYRSDTLAPLGIVTRRYKTVQPQQVLSFFAELVKVGRCELETAGALSDGRQVWGLAKLNQGAAVTGNDVVAPYLLLTTSFDGSLATTAKLTAIRVVCHNTLSVALAKKDGEVAERVGSEIKVNHALEFDPHEVRMQLGLFANSFEAWLEQTRRLAEQEIDSSTASRLTLGVIAALPFRPQKGTWTGAGYPYPPLPEDLMKTRAYKRIMHLFSGQAIGSHFGTPRSRWHFVNSVTEWVDHERGRSPGTRLCYGLFGIGEAVKRKAYELALQDGIR